MSSKKKVEKIDGEAAATLVGEYLRKEFRPYAITDLLLNLHNRVSKPVLLKILEAGVERGEFIMKQYGKLCFYCYGEKQVEEKKEGEVNATLEMVQGILQEVEVLDKEWAEIKKTVSSLNGVVSDHMLASRIEELKSTEVTLREKVVVMEKQVGNSSTSQTDTTDLDKEKALLEKKARHLSGVEKNVLATLAESVEMSRSGFADWVRELGVEEPR